MLTTVFGVPVRPCLAYGCICQTVQDSSHEAHRHVTGTPHPETRLSGGGVQAENNYEKQGEVEPHGKLLSHDQKMTDKTDEPSALSLRSSDSLLFVWNSDTEHRAQLRAIHPLFDHGFFAFPENCVNHPPRQFAVGAIYRNP